MIVRRIQFLSAPLCFAIAAAVIGFGAPYALAQTSGAGGQAAATAPQEETLTEIVITAERRSETVQSATQSVTAISGAELQEQGITTVQDALAQIPGVSIGQDGAGQSEVFLRGIAAQGGVAPTTGFYFDGVSMPSPAQSTYGHMALDPNLYDVSDVEVLRGPQGTLYGASSMGGTIRINTNQPNLSAFAASVQAIGSATEDGGGGNGSVSGMVNIPLVQDKLALRIVGSDAYTSGWIDRIDLGPTNFPYETAGTNGSVTAIPFDPGAASGNRGNVLGITPVSQDKGSNWQTIEGVRATLLWSPTDSLSIAPMVMYQKLAQGGESLVDLPPGDNVLAHYQPYNVAEPYSDTVKIFSLPIKYTIDNIQLVSETAYIQRNTNQIQDSSEIGVDVFPVAATYAEVGPVWSYEGDNTSQFTQEFRASSTGDGAFQWLGGLYYQNYKSTTSLSTNPANAFVDAAFTAANPTAAPVPSGVDLFNWNLITKLTQYAAFGEASYKLGDFKLTGGVRYFSYNVPETNIYAGAYQAPDNYTAATALVEHLPASASGVTPRVNLSYIPNPDLTLYAQASEGFRPGFGNAQPPESEDCPGGVLPAAAPDTVWNYEGGEKARLMDGHLILNGDVYYEYWKGIQESIDLVCGHGNEFSYSGNAGVARIYGSELEVALPITPEITIGTSVGYADARFVSVSSVSGFFAGEQLPLVSKLTDTTSLLYTHHLDDDYNFVFRATDIYKSSQTFVYIQAPQSNFLNVRLGLVSQHKVSAWLFADNVTDEHTFLGISNAIYSELTDAYRGVSPQPRTIGIELDYAFGGR